jgi:hypothetical protein
MFTFDHITPVHPDADMLAVFKRLAVGNINASGEDFRPDRCCISTANSMTFRVPVSWCQIITNA